jgi:hypothetical protein
MKYIFIMLLLSACHCKEEDSLIRMAKDVEKKERGISIEIKPVERYK